MRDCVTWKLGLAETTLSEASISFSPFSVLPTLELPDKQSTYKAMRAERTIVDNSRRASPLQNVIMRIPNPTMMMNKA